MFDEVIGGGADNVTLTGTDVPQLFFAWRVTDNTFRVFGAAPLMGRPITAEDCKPGAPAVALLSHKAWQSKFGGDPGIVGRTLILNHQPTTVVGVMPPRFSFGGADLWLPATLFRGQSADQQWRLCVIGHLKPGVTMEQVHADMAILTKRLTAVYPNDHPQSVTFEAELIVHSIVKYFQSTYYILMAAVGLLLLIACVNVANLLLARATGREKEFAIRASLGASRGRLVRQLLIESSLLALGGGVLGCLLAWNGLGALVAIIPPWLMATETVIPINGSVLLFTLGAALVCTLLFGLAPALLAVSRDLQEPLKASGRGVGEGRGHHRLRNLLVVGEVALSLVLLTGAGLLIRSFFVLRHAELGYNPTTCWPVTLGSLTITKPPSKEISSTLRASGVCGPYPALFLPALVLLHRHILALAPQSTSPGSPARRIGTYSCDFRVMVSLRRWVFGCSKGVPSPRRISSKLDTWPW